MNNQRLLDKPSIASMLTVKIQEEHPIEISMSAEHIPACRKSQSHHEVDYESQKEMPYWKSSAILVVVEEMQHLAGETETSFQPKLE